jgi:hypothetical protein
MPFVLIFPVSFGLPHIEGQRTTGGAGKQKDRQLRREVKDLSEFEKGSGKRKRAQKSNKVAGVAQ